MATPLEKLLGYTNKNNSINPYDNGSIWSAKPSEEESLGFSSSFDNYNARLLGTNTTDSSLVDPLEAPRNQMNYYTKQFDALGMETPKPTMLDKAKNAGAWTLNKVFDIAGVLGTPINTLTGMANEIVKQGEETDWSKKSAGEQLKATPKLLYDVLKSGVVSGASTLLAPLNGELRKNQIDVGTLFNTLREAKNRPVNKFMGDALETLDYGVGKVATLGLAGDETTNNVGRGLTNFIGDAALSTKFDVEGLGKALKYMNSTDEMKALANIGTKGGTAELDNAVVSLKDIRRSLAESKVKTMYKNTPMSEEKLTSLVDEMLNSPNIKEEAKNIMKQTETKLGGLGDFEGVTFGGKTLISPETFEKLGKNKATKIATNVAGTLLDPFSGAYALLKGKGVKALADNNKLAEAFIGGKNNKLIKSAYNSLQDYKSGNGVALGDVYKSIAGMNESNYIRNIKTFMDNRTVSEIESLPNEMKKAGFTEADVDKIANMIETHKSKIQNVSEVEREKLNADFVTEIYNYRDGIVKTLLNEKRKLQRENVDLESVLNAPDKPLDSVVNTGNTNTLPSIEQTVTEPINAVEIPKNVTISDIAKQYENVGEQTPDMSEFKKIIEDRKFSTAFNDKMGTPSAPSKHSFLNVGEKTVTKKIDELEQMYNELGMPFEKGRRIDLEKYPEKIAEEIDHIQSKKNFRDKSYSKGIEKIGNSKLLGNANKKSIFYGTNMKSYEGMNEALATIDELLAKRKLLNTRQSSKLAEILGDNNYAKGVTTHMEDTEALFNKFMKAMYGVGDNAEVNRTVLNKDTVNALEKHSEEIVDALKYADEYELQTIKQHISNAYGRPINYSDTLTELKKDASYDWSKTNNLFSDAEYSDKDINNMMREMDGDSAIERKRNDWLVDPMNDKNKKEYAGNGYKKATKLDGVRNYINSNAPVLDRKLSEYLKNAKEEDISDAYYQAMDTLDKVARMAALDEGLMQPITSGKLGLFDDIHSLKDFYSFRNNVAKQLEDMKKTEPLLEYMTKADKSIFKKVGYTANITKEAEDEAMNKILNILDSPKTNNAKMEFSDVESGLDFSSIENNDKSVLGNFLDSINGIKVETKPIKNILDPSVKADSVDKKTFVTLNEKLTSDDMVERATIRDNTTPEQIEANYEKVADSNVEELDTLKEAINTYNKNIKRIEDIDKSIKDFNDMSFRKRGTEDLIKWLEDAGVPFNNPKYDKVVDTMVTISELNAFEGLNDSQEEFINKIVDKFNEMGIQEGIIDTRKFGTYMAYVPHLLNPELKDNEAVQKIAKHLGFDLSDPFNKNKMSRKLKDTIDGINSLMKNEYPQVFGTKNFFETNIIRLLGERQLYSNNIQTKRHITDVFKNFEVALPGFKGDNDLNSIDLDGLKFMAQQLGVTVDIPEMKQGIGKLKKVADMDKKNPLDPFVLGAEVEGMKGDKKVTVPYSERDTVGIKPNVETALYRKAIMEKINDIVNGKDKKFTLVKEVTETEKKKIKRVKDSVLNKDKAPDISSEEYMKYQDYQGYVGEETPLPNSPDLSKEDLSRSDIEEYPDMFEDINPFTNVRLDELQDDVIDKVLKHEFRIMDKGAFDQYNSMLKHMAGEQKSKALRIYDKAMNMFKAWAVFSPSFHLNNFIGNSFNSVLQTGMKVFSPSNTKNVYDLLGEFKKVGYDFNKLSGDLHGIPKKDIMEQAVRGGILNGFFDTDLNNVRSFIKGEKELGKNNVWSKILNAPADNVLLRKNKKLGEFIEQRGKMRNYLAHISEGKSIYEATDLTNAALFDYGDLTDFEEGVVKRYIAPFYTFARKNVPFQFEMLANKPMGYYRTAKFFRYQEENESEKDKMIKPDYINGIKIGEGKYFNLETPLQSMTNLASPKNIYNMANPLAKTLIDLTYNKKTYSGSEVSKTDNPLEQLQYVAESNLPAIRTIPKMFGVLSKDESKREDSFNWWFGNRVKSYDVSDAEKQAMYDYVGQLQDKYYKMLQENPELKLKIDDAKKQKSNKANTPLSRLLGI